MQRDFSVDIHISVCGVTGRLHADVDFTGLREFDGVTHQVDHDLSKAVWVSDQRIRHIGRYAAIELEAFLRGSGGQTPQGISQRVAQTERDTFELEASGFDFRKIENVIYQIEKGFGGGLR